MIIMKKQKKYMKLVLSSVLVFVCASANLGMTTQNAKALTSSDLELGISREVSSRGLYTSMSLLLNGGNGKVWVTGKNDITIFPSTVMVIVELYASDIYYASYTDMQLVSRNTIADLNMGETLVAEASTGGVQKYWYGYMKYKVDDRAWEEMNTGTFIYSADGTYLGLA